MKYEKYLIKKDKLDLLSSLKVLNKELINKKIKEFGVDNIDKLKEKIIKKIKFLLKNSSHKIHFEKMLYYENSRFIDEYKQDLKFLFIFLYKNKEDYSYYIQVEIKKIITKTLYNNNWEFENNIKRPKIKDILSTLAVDDLKNIGKTL